MRGSKKMRTKTVRSDDGDRRAYSPLPRARPTPRPITCTTCGSTRPRGSPAAPRSRSSAPGRRPSPCAWPRGERSSSSIWPTPTSSARPRRSRRPRDRRRDPHPRIQDGSGQSDAAHREPCEPGDLPAQARRHHAPPPPRARADDDRRRHAGGRTTRTAITATAARVLHSRTSASSARGDKDRVVVALSAMPPTRPTPGPNGRRAARAARDEARRRRPRRASSTSARSRARSRASRRSRTTRRAASIVEIDRRARATGLVSVEGKSLVWSFDRPTRGAELPAAAQAARAGSPRARVTGRRSRARSPPLRSRRSRPRSTTRTRSVETSAASAAGFASGVARAGSGQGATPAAASTSTSRTPTSTTSCGSSPTSGTSTSSPPTTSSGTSRSACATCRGTRRSTSSSRPRASGWCAPGNLIRVAPLAQLQKERELKLAAAEAGVRAHAARDAPHPDQLRPGERAPGAREGAPLAARLDRRRRAHQRAHRARRRREPEPHRGADPLARHADAAGAHRGANRRGDEQLPRATSASSGAATSTFSAGDRQPDRASRSRRASAPRAATTTTTPRPPASRPSRATSRPRTSPSTSRPPSAPGQAARSASTFGSIDNTFNLSLRLSAAESSGLVRIVSRAAHPDARQPRGADQPGHAHPVLAGQRARRADDLPGGQAPAPREAARHGRRLGRDAREAQPRRARLQPDGPRTATRPSSSARPRPTCS